MSTTLVARVPPNASAYSGSPLHWRATVGIAAAAASDSKALSDTRATMPSVAARSGAARMAVGCISVGGVATVIGLSVGIEHPGSDVWTAMTQVLAPGMAVQHPALT
ncbi:hypothetical protein [Xanthomonas oryzae]|uniref:hypothetical protein n=1 Tax=Xanthomonas oryzae TaxID=347 RepID=UPI000488AFF3|nr:hypothetical protein [Xanthomonas oryzae]AJQ85619.1 hypothetical protein AZ54_18210 [Xanthomonas oryzae pv. oryzae PXO86]MDI9072078.1 hypothetical protein [Xanthomonas oryzae pv. oryzae]MDI9078307.1 hypothetical protein [Xanthomonas oryzae pv. oryzae]MDI9105487.1 hypothetical protein [Xanthomonas oryzae pv. oryzae]MDI9913037.1 hypothetical protein [Xanthomonas oryzae pv. oryzae]